MKNTIQKSKNSAPFIRNLRRKKLRNGFPFMINVENLPSRQCYYEFPDGRVELVEIISEKEIITLNILSKKETIMLLRQLDFIQ